MSLTEAPFGNFNGNGDKIPYLPGDRTDLIANVVARGDEKSVGSLATFGINPPTPASYK